MNSEKLQEYLDKYGHVYTFKLPNSLHNIIEEVQKIIEFAMAVENISKELKPKLVLGEDEHKKKSDETMEYEKPYVFITLGKRAYCGANIKSTLELFQGNVISGVPKYARQTVYDDDIVVEKSVVFTDNEFVLTLKTKTVKEQLQLVNILERALNVYCRKILSKFVTVCGIKEITTSEKKDEERFVTTKILFQLRLMEEVEADETFILRGFSIFAGNEDEKLAYESGKLDTNGNWEDNVSEEFITFKDLPDFPFEN